MKCFVCNSENVAKKYSNFPGYIEGTYYDIFECLECNSNFIDTSKIDKKIYEVIYSQENIPGYERYFRYMKEIKKQKNPLEYLFKKESIYFPVYDYLKNKPKLKILEIGCGNGYLTYSLNSLGHSASGIDISEEAIKSAKTNFGNYFAVSDLKDYRPKEKFDLIIATEVIEHLKNPSEFILQCLALLKENGEILLTTPNKDYYNRDIAWKSESPPVHTFWFSKQSFKAIAKRYNLAYKFVNPFKLISSSQNLLSCMLTKHNRLPSPILNKEGKPFLGRESDSLARIIVRKFFDFGPIRYISNLLMFKTEPPHFAVFFKKRQY